MSDKVCDMADNNADHGHVAGLSHSNVPIPEQEDHSHDFRPMSPV